MSLHTRLIYIHAETCWVTASKWWDQDRGRCRSLPCICGDGEISGETAIALTNTPLNTAALTFNPRDFPVKRRTFLTGTVLGSLPILLGKPNWVTAAYPTFDPIVLHPLDDQQRQFLSDLKTACYRFFTEAADPNTGLVADRASTDGSIRSSYSSAACCGFALTAYAMAADGQWAERLEAERRTRQLLESLLNIVEHANGFVYHYFNCTTGRRSPHSEASSIDTAIMVAGAMVSATTFGKDSEIGKLADELCDRVNWQWMLAGGNQFRMGWKPETGFLPESWDRFSELSLLVLLAIGARNHRVSPECWKAWRREETLYHNGRSFLSYPPLFVHQYPQAFFDFQNYRSPEGRDYWENSVVAHEAQIDYLTRLGQRFPQTFAHYGPELWGLTSSDSETGYRDWGGPYRQDCFDPERGMDGTVVPSAAAGGLPIVPDAAMRTLMHQYSTYGERIFGRYGFVNAYNPRTGWTGPDVIGIDTGITLLMAENFERSAVWKRFMQHDIAQRGLEKAGFTPVSVRLSPN